MISERGLVVRIADFDCVYKLDVRRWAIRLVERELTSVDDLEQAIAFISGWYIGRASSSGFNA